MRFSNGEWNVLVVCRDKVHTYLVAKYIMAEPFAMNNDWTKEGGWPACRMREHVQGIYDMLPEDIRKTVIPMHIKQHARDEIVECDDMAFLLSTVNVFGENAEIDGWNPEIDCDDTQIDIFQKPVNRIKRCPGASSASWWRLRSSNGYYGFNIVSSDGTNNYNSAYYEGGVVVVFCIESRS